MIAARRLVIDEDDIAMLITDHHVRRLLCKALERIADALPDLPCAETALSIDRQLCCYVEGHFQLESGLFLRLAMAPQCPTSKRILKEICHNSAIDTVHAEDLSVELRRLTGTSRAACPGELAYMLRCFFEGCRRAIAFEELALLELGQDRLTPAARRAVLLSFQAG